MIEWLKKRASEPSTWRGVGFVLVAVGVVPAAALDVFVSVGLGIVALVEVVRNEK